MEKITLVKHRFGCYALSAEGIDEEHEPFFQIDMDIASLAETIGYRHDKGSWEEQENHADACEVIAGAYDYLDEREGEEMDPNIVDAYFDAEDRGWE